MNSLEKKIETFANIAIIVLAISILVFFGYRYFSNPVPEIEQIKVGTSISIPNTDWANQKQTLLLILQKGCHFCTESAAFYQKLSKSNQNQNSTKIIAVLPNSLDESNKYLKELGVEADDIRQANLSSIGVRGTPTLILVDAQGKVLDSWVGKLNTETEEKVLQKIFCDKAEGCS